MKKIIFFMALVLSVSLFVACSSTSIGWSELPATTQIVQGKEYTVLGRVTEKFDEDHYGYTVLLQAAQKKYPDCVDIVNIFIDVTDDDEYIMSALAIKY